jgi:hypothetical protein
MDYRSSGGKAFDSRRTEGDAAIPDNFVLDFTTFIGGQAFFAFVL